MCDLEKDSLKAEIEKLRSALISIRFSSLSMGWGGDKSTTEDHLDYSYRVASEALGEDDECFKYKAAKSRFQDNK